MPVREREPLSDYGLLTVAEAAARRGWGLSRLERWIQAGRIPVIIAGRGRNRMVYLLAVEDVDAFAEPPMGRPKKEPPE